MKQLFTRYCTIPILALISGLLLIGGVAFPLLGTTRIIGDLFGWYDASFIHFFTIDHPLIIFLISILAAELLLFLSYSSNQLLFAKLKQCRNLPE